MSGNQRWSRNFYYRMFFFLAIYELILIDSEVGSDIARMKKSWTSDLPLERLMN